MEQLTLSVDCGGLGIKASVLDSAGTMRAQAIRISTPYPLSPTRLIETIVDLSKSLPSADRVSVGMPGMMRHGVVVSTPHYINTAGPRTRMDPELKAAWDGFDMREGLTHALGKPTLVLNDAEVHGAGVVAGSGFEVVLTLGTGLGCAVFDGGKLAPILNSRMQRFGATKLLIVGSANISADYSEILFGHVASGQWSMNCVQYFTGTVCI